MLQRTDPVGRAGEGQVDVVATAIADVKLIAPKRFDDERGFFSETFSMKAMSDWCLPAFFVQDNRSFSRRRGTVRGLHFQMPPRAQNKLLWVARGAILDVAVDLRRDSPSYGRHVAVELSAASGRQIFVPIGFAHGFCTLEPDTEVVYKVSDFYAPESEVGIHWNDPALDIAWPVPPGEAVLSGRDETLPRLADIADILPFRIQS